MPILECEYVKNDFILAPYRYIQIDEMCRLYNELAVQCCSPAPK